MSFEYIAKETPKSFRSVFVTAAAPGHVLRKTGVGYAVGRFRVGLIFQSLFEVLNFHFLSLFFIRVFIGLFAGSEMADRADTYN